MTESNSEICIRLRILNSQRQPLGGTVDLEFKRQNAGQATTIKNAAASRDIDVRGLQRAPQGLYQLTVTPTDVYKPVSQFVNIPARGFNTLEIVIDKGSTEKPAPPPGGESYRVFGTVRDKFQKVMAGVTVRAVDKDIRGEQPLGSPVTTDASGAYQVVYSAKDFANTDLLAPDIVVRVFGQDDRLLKESEVFYNATRELRVDIDLSDQSYAGPSEFEQTDQTIKPFIGKLPPSQLSEDQKVRDISFLVNKTGLSRSRVEAFAMAFRFEKNTLIKAPVFYGLIQHGPSATTLTQPTGTSSATNFDSKTTMTFASLMRQDIDVLMSAVQGAIDANVIPFSLSGEMD